MKDKHQPEDNARAPTKKSKLIERLLKAGGKGRGLAREGLDTSGEIVGKAVAGSSRIAKKTIDGVEDVAQASLGAASSGLSNVADLAQDGAHVVLDYARDSVETLQGNIFRETSVPVFLLPTGSRHSDFFITYSFESALETLRTGTFVRPVLEIWASRPDVDRGRLIEDLNSTFLSDFRRQKDSVRDQRRQANMGTVVAIRENEARMEDAAEDLGSHISWVGVGLVGMFLAANPLFDLLFLILAVYQGRAGITKILGGWQLAKTGATKEADLRKSKREFSKLEAELDSKNETFRAAVSNLDVKVHRQLQDLLVDFAAVDGLSYVPVPPAPDGPDVRPAMQMPEYRQALPDWGLTIVEAHQSVVGQHAD